MTILDEGCAERGCPMHDERESKGVAFMRKEWVGLTDAEIQKCYSEAYKITHGRRLEVSFTRVIEAKLKEKNYG